MFGLIQCTDDRARDGVVCPSWKEEIQAVVADRCLACHGDEEPEGNYRLIEYDDALGGGSDATPNAIAGDPASALLSILDPATADSVHAEFADLRPLLATWVVSCDIRFGGSPIHKAGLLDPTSEDFHGHLLRELAYNFENCASCHGDGFDGGAAEAPCTTCHASGPTDCVTCHGDGPDSGAHVAHRLVSPGHREVPCESCHPQVSSVGQPGHVVDADGNVDEAPAEVVFGGIAGSRATFNRDTGSCTGVYCHGAESSDSAAQGVRPSWNDPPQPGSCDRCHGQPPSSHGGDPRCASCHRTAFSRTGALLADTHVNGTTEVGANCTDCHGGGGAGAAPPPDLDGEIAGTSIGVGAHVSHVLGSHRVAAPLGCNDCHLEPGAVNAPGHIDTPAPAELFPAGSAALARTGGATPTWTRATASCADVYCHGGGPLFADDGAANLNRTPTWTSLNAGEASCGACHGIPPVNANHAPGLGLGDCAGCHPATVDGFGNILFDGSGGTSHVNGTVEVIP